MKRIHDSLQRVFQRQRLVFWYDATGEWAETFLRDFAVSLFRGANPLDGQVPLHPHARVFLQRWKDSQAHSVSFRQWSHQMEREENHGLHGFHG